MKKFDNVVVTIGRQMGSGGRQVGKRLAEMLGMAYYDKELLAEAARETDISPEFFEMNDERRPSLLAGIMPFSLGLSAHSFYPGPQTISSDSVYRAQSDFIAGLPDRVGACVIVGRSADHVLRHNPRLASVFVCAPLDERVKRIMSRMPDVSADKARMIAERTDKLRANYYNFYTDRSWGVASNYDLCVNTGGISVDEAAEMIAEYLERRFGRCR